MKFNELNYLVILAREKHFGKAAKKACVSQPTLSIAISNIEKRLGVPLFERLNKEIKVTDLGERIVSQAQKVLDEVHILNNIVAGEKTCASEPLNIGAIHTVGPYLFPKILKKISKDLPDTPLKIEEGYTKNLTEKLLAGELDALFLATPIKDNNVVQKVLFEEPLFWVLPKGHPLNNKSAITEAAIKDEKFLILPEENCLRAQVLQQCPSCLSNENLALLEGTSIETIKQMVASHYGISILPEMAASAFGYKTLIDIKPINKANAKRKIYLCWRASFPRPKIINGLINSI